MSRPAGRGDPSLVLVPTALELRALEACGGLPPGHAILAACGFGPAAAAKAAALIRTLRPARALLLGIAGSLDPGALPVGSAAAFARVAIDGLDTAGFELAPGLGLGTAIALQGGEGLLVTVATPSRSRAESASLAARHAGATAEDMEGFGVAVACALAGVPLAILRGISNEAGDRDRSRWRIPEAVAAARELSIALLGGDPGREAS